LNFPLAIHGKEFSADMKPVMEKLWADISTNNRQIQISESFFDDL
jgi:hypothetical protein